MKTNNCKMYASLIQFNKCLELTGKTGNFFCAIPQTWPTHKSRILYIKYTKKQAKKPFLNI